MFCYVASFVVCVSFVWWCDLCVRADVQFCADVQFRGLCRCASFAICAISWFRGFLDLCFIEKGGAKKRGPRNVSPKCSASTKGQISCLRVPISVVILVLQSDTSAFLRLSTFFPQAFNGSCRTRLINRDLGGCQIPRTNCGAPDTTKSDKKWPFLPFLGTFSNFFPGRNPLHLGRYLVERHGKKCPPDAFRDRTGLRHSVWATVAEMVQNCTKVHKTCTPPETAKSWAFRGVCFNFFGFRAGFIRRKCNWTVFDTPQKVQNGPPRSAL